MIFLAILVLVCFSSCGQTTNKIDTYNQYIFQKIEPRDSIFVLYTVKEWGKLNWWTWGIRKDLFHIKEDEVELFIGGTFYSPDKTKILIWVGEKKSNAKSIEVYNEDPEVNKICPNGSAIIYSMSALIGFRELPNSIWKLYPFDNKKATCYSSKEEVINVFGQYYFSQMKQHSEYVSKRTLNEKYGGEVRYDLEDKKKRLGYGQVDTSSILKNYGYNLQDKGFWERSLIWQKGATKEGYYNFQLHGKELFNVPVIEYSKEILDLYK